MNQAGKGYDRKNGEDNFMRKGISKYGYGRWTSMLNNPSFKFHLSRKPCTLAVRAKKVWFCDKGQFDDFTFMSQTIKLLISFLSCYF